MNNLKTYLILAITIVAGQTYYSQILDFEFIEENKVGDEVMTFDSGLNCQVHFFTSYDLKSKAPFYLQRVGVQSTACFQGVKRNIDCSGSSISENRFNNMNTKGYKLNPNYSNKDRVGCQFISATLKGNNMPSVFIQYDEGVKQCSGDILDVDGANDAIEAYDIYYYKSPGDYPLKPISKEPLKIRTSGSSFGNGEIGDDGGIEHFEIYSSETFTLIEIRPNQQPNNKNKIRSIFGFALDNFSPCNAELPPFTPHYMITKPNDKILSNESNDETIIENEVNEVEIEDVYFGFDETVLVKKEVNKLDELILLWKENKNQKIELTAYTDPKGSNDYNLLLSKKRVNTVKAYLIENGVSKDQIFTNFKGEKYSGNKNDADWKKRKVEIEIN